MPPETSDLARYQAALLALLAEPDVDAARARARLTTDPAFAPFRDVVERFEPRMLATAIELTRRWGRPDVTAEAPTPGPASTSGPRDDSPDARVR